MFSVYVCVCVGIVCNENALHCKTTIKLWEKTIITLVIIDDLLNKKSIIIEHLSLVADKFDLKTIKVSFFKKKVQIYHFSICNGYNNRVKAK